jgi:hypothetical protein
MGGFFRQISDMRVSVRCTPRSSANDYIKLEYRNAKRRRVVLSGPVRSDEVQQLIKGIRAVRGVTDVENRLTVHDDAAQLPGLQGDKPKPAGQVWDIMQRRWSPSTRFLVGTAGAFSLGLIAYSLSDGSLASPQSGRRKEITGQEET